MRHLAAIALVAALFTASAGASADRPQAEVVAVRFLVSEQSPERLAQALLRPVEGGLMMLGGVTAIDGTAGHGYVGIEIQFEGGATEKDVATVTGRIEELLVDSEIPVTSRTIGLAAPRSARYAVFAAGAPLGNSAQGPSR